MPLVEPGPLAVAALAQIQSVAWAALHSENPAQSIAQALKRVLAIAEQTLVLMPRPSNDNELQ